MTSINNSMKLTNITQTRSYTMTSIDKTARIAGLMYLLNIVTGIFAEFVRSTLIVSGDAAATAKNIAASALLFRFGIVSDIMMTTCFLLMGFAFYVLLRSVHQNLALLMLLLNLVGIPVMSLNMLNQFAPLLLLSGADYLKVFSTDQLQALVMVFIDLYKHGYLIAAISYGAYLLPLGLLVYKSGYFPKILGVLLILDCFGLLMPFSQTFLFPGYDVVTYPGLAIGVIAEFSFCLWLLIKGAKDPKPAPKLAN
jgi:hypothetical protein